MSKPEHTSTTDETREVIELPITLHKSAEGLHLWSEAAEEAVGIDTFTHHIERIEGEVFNRLPEGPLTAAERNLPSERKRDALGRDAPKVAVVECFPADSEIGGVALDFDADAKVALFPKTDTDTNAGEQR